MLIRKLEFKRKEGTISLYKVKVVDNLSEAKHNKAVIYKSYVIHQVENEYFEWTYG